jgi:hypothetical protein
VLATVASVQFLCDSVSYKVLCWFRQHVLVMFTFCILCTRY